MENMTAFDIMKLESILHTILLSDDVKNEIDIVGKDEVYNEKMYYYLNIIADNINLNKYYFYRTVGILEQFKQLLLLINQNCYKKEILNIRAKINEIESGTVDNLIQIQAVCRTFSNSLGLIRYSRDLYLYPFMLFEQMRKDCDLIIYFEGKDCKLDSDNIRSLTYFYNMNKYFYLDNDIYAKTIGLLNTNLDALKDRKMIFSNKYSDNKKLLKILGGKHVK